MHFILGEIMVICFLRNWSIHLICQIYTYMIVLSMPYYVFYVCRICSNIPCFNLDKLYLLFYMSIFLVVCQSFWSQRAWFCSVDFLYYIFAYNFNVFYLFYFFLKLLLGLFCSSFSKFLRGRCRPLIWGFSYFIMWAFSVINSFLALC